MDGKGREGTYNFSHDDWGRWPGGQGIGHRGQIPPPATPFAPPMRLGKFPDLVLRTPSVVKSWVRLRLVGEAGGRQCVSRNNSRCRRTVATPSSTPDLQLAHWRDTTGTSVD